MRKICSLVLVMVVACFLAISVANAAEKKGGGDKPKATPEEMFQKLDKNGDGFLTKDEVPEKAWTNVSKKDKDGDGKVSKEEFLAKPAGGKGKKDKK